MARKTKEQNLDLYNDNKKEKKKKVSKNEKNEEVDKENTFCFDDEIIIGVTRLPEEKQNEKKLRPKKKAKTKSKLNKKSNSKKSKNSKNVSSKNKKVNLKKKNISKEALKKRNRTIKIIKYSTLLICILVAIICTMFSPLFNIENINVVGNSKISKEEIISLSQIQTGENTYKVSKLKTMQKIKQNAYIESVTIKRKLPSEIEIEVKERRTSFLLEYASSFVYINNQGYVLEISSEKLDLPIIQGQETEDSEFIEGNRLCENDLEKLSTVIKIMELAQSNEISSLVTRIDISNSRNYKLVFESEGKIAYLGDSTDLNTKILKIKAIIEKEKGVEGEIFVNMDYTKDAVFREKV